jgi:hypothetical protein
MRFSILLIFLTVIIACSEKDEKLDVRSINFHGCNKSLKSGSENSATNFAVRYELFGNKLKISRSAKLNCASDSFSVQVDTYNNSITIYETAYATNAVFCNCSMTYEYVIGPLYLKEYEIKIISPNNEKYVFKQNIDSLISGDICN